MKKKIIVIMVIALAGLGIWQTGRRFFMQNKEQIDTKKGYERLIELENRSSVHHPGNQGKEGDGTKEASSKDKGDASMKVESTPEVHPAGNPEKAYVRWKKHPLSIKEAKKAFENSVILGDSIVEAMDVYGILYANELVYSRGKSIGQADELVEETIGLMPENVFIVFGLNDLEYYSADEKRFAKEYKIQIKKIQKALPDCKIYVNSINPVQKFSVTKENNLDKLEEYNEALKKLCAQENIVYIDSQPIIKGKKDLYEPDGIHPTYSYYSKWLALLAEVAALGDE